MEIFNSNVNEKESVNLKCFEIMQLMYVWIWFKAVLFVEDCSYIFGTDVHDKFLCYSSTNFDRIWWD